MKISLEKLTRIAAERPPGYFEDCIAAGTLKDGWLYLTPLAYKTLSAKYRPASPSSVLHPPSSSREMRGFGDAIALVAKPIARTIDKVAGTNLEKCGGCAKRQAKLNAAFPFPNG